MTEGPTLQIHVMGPFRAFIGRTAFAPTAAKPCQLLTLLAVQTGRTVSADTCISELWGSTPPASAAATLQTYVHRLRQHIATAVAPGRGGSAREFLRTDRGGYSLHLNGGATDLAEFESIIADGDQDARTGRQEQASAALREALSRVRGPLASDLPLGPVLELERQRIQSRVCAVRARRIDLDIALSRHHDLLWEIGSMLREDPLNEALSSKYMTCLYHTGQIGPALAEYARLRSALVEELGVEPTERVRRVQRMILAGGEDTPGALAG